jgi:hypothetical protein
MRPYDLASVRSPAPSGDELDGVRACLVAVAAAEPPPVSFRRTDATTINAADAYAPPFGRSVAHAFEETSARLLIPVSRNHRPDGSPVGLEGSEP